MADSVKYTVYPSAQKQSAALLLIILATVLLTGVLAYIYLGKAASVPTDIPVPPVAPMVPNPAPSPNPR